MLVSVVMAVNDGHVTNVDRTGACSSACFLAQPTLQCPLLPRLVILTSK